MNKIIAILFFGCCTSGMTQAAVTSSGGTIHFYGAIVEDGCIFNTSSNKLTSQCYRSGKTLQQTRTIDTKNLPNFSLPQSIGQVSTRNVNNNPHLAIMTVSYN
ncbi:hypothetical protein [Ewingella americana]|jgi:type 1 fimbria pilin|nr:hypothetical protein [Ewingella americana]KAA8730371.1 hypothetical protein F4W05_09345 [Ewingella americana]STQ43909.1 Uncharacterised protein [Ewingella americana]